LHVLHDLAGGGMIKIATLPGARERGAKPRLPPQR